MQVQSTPSLASTDSLRSTICPPFLYGPFAQGFSLPTSYFGALSTSFYIYRLLTPAGSFPAFAVYIDVREISIPSLDALSNVTLPSDFTTALQNLNNPLPTVSDLKDKVDALCVLFCLIIIIFFADTTCPT